MAKIEHANISDPYIHEPKGIQFAADGQAYIADGAGGGSWSDILTPDDVGLYPGVEYSFSRTFSSSSSLALRDLDITLVRSWDGGAASNTDSFISITNPGLYLVNMWYLISDYDDDRKMQPTSSSSSLVSLSPMTPMINTRIVSVSDTMRYGTNRQSASFIRSFVIGEGIGFYTETSPGAVISGAVQLVRLRDA